MDINYIDIGNRIRAKRLKKNLTQEKLAEMSSMSLQHMNGIENGKTKFSCGSIVRIANALEISIDELLCGSLTHCKPLIQNEFAELLSDCSHEEAMLILDTVKAMKKSMKMKKNDDIW